MKKLTTIVLTFLPILIWAHQDRYYTFQYDNVTVRFKTGFYFEEINNAKIIGKYAALLSASMNFEQPILLDFIHDYGHTYQGKTFSFLNIGSGEYEMISYYERDSVEENVYHMFSYSDSVEAIENVEKNVFTVPDIDEKKKIVIRQFGYYFDVTQTLNILNYAITNLDEVTILSRTDTLSSYLRNMYYSFETVPTSLIDSIKFPIDLHVQRILDNQVYKEIDSTDRNRLYYSYFSKNGKYLIFAGIHDKEIILDTLNQVYSFNPMAYFTEILFVFETPDQMRKYSLMTYRDYEYSRSQKHKIQFDRNEYIVSININWLDDDLYLINYRVGFGWAPVKRLLYLNNEDILIEDFDTYLNTHRNKEK